MGETTGDASTASISKPKPTVLVPPRGSMGFLFANGFSPGPMTLLSSFFPEQGSFSFSQLLAGAMASPLAAAKPSSSTDGINSESGVGHKWNIPANFAAAQPQLESLSPLFVVPPALSPSGLPNSPGYLSPLQSPFGMSHQQALAHVTAQAALSQSFMQMQAEFQPSSSTDAPEESLTLTHQTNPLPSKQETSKIDSSEVSQSDKKTSYIAADNKPASDGYNWRKYGQKHVKASERPRSYYKCTHINCPAKKKVERSLDGHISEVAYKGQHNHDLPKPSTRGKDGSASDKTMKSAVEADRSNEAAPIENHPVVISHNDGMEDSAVVVIDGDGDERIAKKRSLDIEPSMPASSHQTVGESKIVLQTRSEVDLLDDGYKWRKYGQKVVKGNPYPRSYYRCTYAGCNVRKHVERASADPKSVITTYEGKHNHEIPIGRYSSHGSANHQQLKAQKTVSKKPSPNKEIDYGIKDQIPITLQLKEEQIAA